MSVADIIKLAIERAAQINEKHAADVNDTQREFAANLGKPWKFRAEKIREVTQPENEDDE